MKIGPYTLKRHSYTMRDPDGWRDTRVADELHITRDSGEGMGCNAEDEKKLIEMLNKFWTENF